MDNALILTGIAVVHLLAIASPGPTLVLVTSYSIGGDRRAGLLLTLGVCLATLTWSSLAAAGLGTMVASFPSAYRVLQLIGAAYLIYLGVKLLVSTVRKTPGRAATETSRRSGWEAVRAGYITNMTNPKVIAYYASLFGVMIPANAPGWLFWGAAATALAVSALWWSGVTLFFSVPLISRAYARIRPGMDAVMGGALVLLGLRLAI